MDANMTHDPRVTILHKPNGKSQILVDGKLLPGVVQYRLSQGGVQRAELTITLHGQAFTVESDMTESVAPSPPADRMVDRRSPTNWTDSRSSHEVNGSDQPDIDDRIYVSERYNGRYSESLRMLLDVLSK